MKITFSPIANDHSFSKRVLYKKHFSWLNVPAPAKEEKILSEFYQIAFRKKIYESIEMLQNDLDEYAPSVSVAHASETLGAYFASMEAQGEKTSNSAEENECAVA